MELFDHIRKEQVSETDLMTKNKFKPDKQLTSEYSQERTSVQRNQNQNKKKIWVTHLNLSVFDRLRHSNN